MTNNKSVLINKFIDKKEKYHPTFVSCLSTNVLPSIIVVRWNNKISNMLRFAIAHGNSGLDANINNIDYLELDYELPDETFKFIEKLETNNPTFQILPDVHLFDKELAEDITKTGRAIIDKIGGDLYEKRKDHKELFGGISVGQEIKSMSELFHPVYPQETPCPMENYLENLPPDVKERIRIERIKMIHTIKCVPPMKDKHQFFISNHISLIP